MRKANATNKVNMKTRKDNCETFGHEKCTDYLQKTDVNEHTPTPWKFVESTANDVPTGEALWLTDGNEDRSILFMKPCAGRIEQARLDAAFIVRAVNVHEEMLAALKTCLSSLRCVGTDENNDTCGVTFTCHPCGVLRLAKQAIAKAENQ